MAAIFISGASATLAILANLASAALFRVVVVDDSRRVAALDELFSELGWCACRQAGAARLPGDGLHFLLLGGAIVGRRTTTPATQMSDASAGYRLYIWGKGAQQALEHRTEGSERGILARWLYHPAPWRCHVTTERQEAPASARPWQRDLANRAAPALEESERWSVLISGPPGCGKSRFAEILALALKAARRCDPVVVKNFDPTARGSLVDDAIGCATRARPVVLVINEYDGGVRHAEGALDGAGEGASLARNRASWLNCLDRLAAMRHVCVVATTNAPLESLEEAYVRPGRFDTRHTVADAEA